MGQTAPRVWLLLGGRRGDNNQLLALAEGLGLPFEAKTLRYNWLRHLPLLHRLGLTIVSRKSRSLIAPPWPDLVISIAYSGVAVARFIRKQSGGRTRLVHIGNPRTATDDLDLLIVTPQFSRKEGPNVLALPFPIGNPARTTTASDEEEQWLRNLPRPRRLIAIGGSTRKWRISDSELDRAVEHLQNRSASDGGSVIAVTSPRTTQRTRGLLEARLVGHTDALVDRFPRFGVLLARCDECYVTADSVSMLSEAIVTGKPVGMIAIRRSLRGAISHWLRRHVWSFRSSADLSLFWDFLTAHKLVGTVESPIASDSSDTVSTAVNAARSLIQ
jgi:mitochondrial fission protein ELM1